MTSTVRNDLLAVGAISPSRLEVFSTRTRDCETLTVYRDTVSRVIFIEDHYVGLNEYVSGAYRNEIHSGITTKSKNFQDYSDTARRIESYKHLLTNRTLCDFGCGAGSFLRGTTSYVNNSFGVELQEDYVSALTETGITCYRDLESSPARPDVITLFHSFEHLPSPLSALRSLFYTLPKGGQLIIEVPHAKDFLLDYLDLPSFKDFTLWSQHLILHTRLSLQGMLEEVGFKDITIEGVQRFNLSNHIHWLRKNEPGGHSKALSVFESEALKSAYTSSLAKIDATDTLVAIATKQ